MEWWDTDRRVTNVSHAHGLMQMGILKAVQEMADMQPKETRLNFLNYQDELGETLVMCATRRQDIQALLWLKEEGADFELGDYNKRTPQSVAKESNNPLLLALVTRNMEEFKRLDTLRKAQPSSTQPPRALSMQEILRQTKNRLIQKKISQNSFTC